MTNTTKNESRFSWIRVDAVRPGTTLAEWPEYGPVVSTEPIGGGVVVFRFESGACHKFLLDAEVRLS